MGQIKVNRDALRLQQETTVTVKLMNASLDKRFSKQTEDLTKIFADQINVALKKVMKQVDTNAADIKTNVMKIESLSIKSDDNQKSITSLSNRVQLAENRLDDCSTSNSINNVLCEMRERDKRACNVILFGFTDNDNVKKDLTELKKLFVKLQLDVTVRKIFRLGKIVENKTRPLKIILSLKDMAKTLLMNRKLFKDKKLNVDSDKTPYKKQYLDSVRVKLESRLADGESDFTIKYVNNVPTIVTKNV